MAKATLNNVRIQLRNDTATNWAKSTVVLLAGEFAVENDTGLFKIGNGTDIFSALPYANNAAEVAQEFNALKDKIGEIPDDKTIIAMIQEASYDDAAIQAGIAANKEAIDTLNGDGEGSVKKTIADATVNPLNITGATVGQVAKIKAVDTEGKPTEWVTANIPTKTSDLINDDGFIKNIPDEYVTEAELEAKGYLTQHQDLTNYALKSEIPTLEDYAKISELDAKQDKLTAGAGISIKDNVISATGGGTGFSGVESVNGKTGAVTLAASDVITSSSDMNKVSINSDNTLEVNTISFDKIVQQDTDEIIISGGNA